jgi:hypothetical protein
MDVEKVIGLFLFAAVDGFVVFVVFVVFAVAALVL